MKFFFLLWTVWLYILNVNGRNTADVLKYVDPFIGSGGIGFGAGSLNPGAQIPFGSYRLGIYEYYFYIMLTELVLLCYALFMYIAVPLSCNL